jgi:aspartate aminotransferase
MVGLSRNITKISSSVTLDITAKAKKMSQEGVDVVSFGAGEPDFDTPAHIKQAAVKAIEEGFTKYTPSSGMLELREAIAKKFHHENGLVYKPSQIVVSCGAKHSLFNIFQAVLNESDEAIIPSPYWVSYPEMVKAQGGIPVYLETSSENQFKVTESQLKSKITKRTKVFILNSPSNPTGCVYDVGELNFIARLATKFNFYVVSDEIYEKLIYDGKRHVSIASLGEGIYGRTIVVNGVSKSYSMTGWRIGYAAGPSDVMEAISNLQSHATSNPTSISQRAALEALSGDQSCVEAMRGEFETRRNHIVDGIRRIEGLSCVKPEGAFYVFCDISGLGMGSVELANRLLNEVHVAVVPGAGFGADKFIRLSFATSLGEIKRGLDRIETWVKKRNA